MNKKEKINRSDIRLLQFHNYRAFIKLYGFNSIYQMF